MEVWRQDEDRKVVEKLSLRESLKSYIRILSFKSTADPDICPSSRVISHSGLKSIQSGLIDVDYYIRIKVISKE
jgi:hypothetical protein